MEQPNNQPDHVDSKLESKHGVKRIGLKSWFYIVIVALAAGVALGFVLWAADQTNQQTTNTSENQSRFVPSEKSTE